MICTEKGVLPGSHYFFFTPSENFKAHYYYMLVYGKFICDSMYKIVRKGGVSPLVFYIEEGELCLNYRDSKTTAHKGDVVLIDCADPHAYHCPSHCEFLFFHFDGANSVELTNHLIEQNGGPVSKLENQDAVYEIMNTLFNGLCGEAIPSEIERSCAVYQTLCHIQSSSGTLPASSSPSSQIVSGVIDYIRDHVGEHLTLEVLSNQANLSKYYFSHIFKEETGLSPIEYVAQVRVTLAMTILKTTSRTVADIATSLGYSSSCSFINSFTARAGMSPNKYRYSSFKGA